MIENRKMKIKTKPYIILVATVSELEGMVTGQRQLMEKLTVECKTLTNKLEDATLKHK